MLVLSRKEGEGLLLGDDIEIKVTEISKGVIKLGIKAPKDLLVLRSELAEQIKKINKDASHADEKSIELLSKVLKVKS